MAADLSLKAPGLGAPVWSWAGLYIGVNAGRGIAKGTIEDKDCFFCTSDSFHRGFGEEGIQIGYNWQFGSAVLGIEADWNWNNLDYSGSIGLDDQIAGHSALRLDSFGSVRARAGLAFDRTLVYVTAGPAWGRVNGSVTGFCQDFAFGCNVSMPFWGSSTWQWGLLAGAGVEVMLTPNWSVRGEYLALALTDSTILGGNTECLTSAFFQCRTGFLLSEQIARVGLNYKFDGAPLAAMAAAFPVATSAYPLKAPPAYAASAWSWAGLYVGLNAGGGVATGKIEDKDCFFCASDSFHRGVGEVGAQIGYNWQFGSAVVGVEADWNWNSLDYSGLIGLDDSVAGRTALKLDSFGSLRARAGLAYDRTLLYVTAGPAWGQARGSVSGFCLTANGCPNSQTPLWSTDSWRWGMLAGAGIEVALAPGWSVRGEYLVLTLADDTVSAGNLKPSVEDCRTTATGTRECRMGFLVSEQLARIGVNYRFAGGPAYAGAAAFPVKAPAAYGAPFQSWAGLYVGVNAGGGMALGTVEDKDCFFCASDSFHRGIAELGGQIGYNWQTGALVYGVEADLNWNSLDYSGSIGLDDLTGGRTALKLDSFGSIRGRAGLTHDRTLVYVTAGPAWGHLRGSVTGSCLRTNGCPDFTQPFPLWSTSSWQWGVAAGVGVEVMVAPNWSLRGEYLALALTDSIAAIPSNLLADRTNCVNSGSRTRQCRIDFRVSEEIARVGVNYRFDAPVVAK